MLKKLFSHSLLYAIGPQIPRIVSIFILPLTTAYLTAEDYGTSAVLMAYTGAIAALKDLGVLILLVNYFFQRKNTWPLLWRRLYGYILTWSPLYLILQSIVIYAALPKSQMHNYWSIVVMYAITNIVFDVPISFGSRFLQLSQKPLPIAIASATVGSIGIILNLLTIVYFKMGYMGWIVSTFFSSFVSFLFYSYFTFYQLKLFPIFKYQLNHVRSLLKISLPTIPHIYSSYLLNTSDRAILKFYEVSLDSIGKYNLAYSFGSYFEVFSTAVGMAVGPLYAKLYSLNKHLMAKNLTLFLQYLFLTIGFNIAIWMKEIIDLLISNQDLKTSYQISTIIIISFLSKPFYWSTVNLMIYIKHTSDLWKISFTGGIISIVCNLVLIPVAGIWGAAISAFVSLSYINFIGGYLKKIKETGRKKHNETYWISIIAAILILSIFTVKLNYAYKIIISAIFTILNLFPILKYYNILKNLEKEF